jgi:methyl-accepting chemotaxis protein
MAKQTTKIAIPIIFVGFFAIIAFIAAKPEQLEPDFYIIIGLLFVFIFFFGIAAGQRLSSPVRKLLKQANDLNKGNLESRTYLETKDELADLANAFNKVAEELQKSREQAQNAEKSVGIKVKAKTQEMEETINALEQKVKNRTIELERLLKEAGRSTEAVKDK